jgi:hypothetical protein
MPAVGMQREGRACKLGWHHVQRQGLHYHRTSGKNDENTGRDERQAMVTRTRRT